MAQSPALQETADMEKLEVSLPFGQRVKSLRKRQGWTQEELAQQIGKTVDTISNIERGFSSTRIETAVAIADALGTTLSDLFDFQTVPPEQREARRLTNELLELIRPLDASTIEAITAQVEILLRVRERASK